MKPPHVLHISGRHADKIMDELFYLNLKSILDNDEILYSNAASSIKVFAFLFRSIKSFG